MFVDEVFLKVEAGSGGDGCLAFRREKYIPMGGPFGGNGGKGSDIKFVVDEGLGTLIDLRYMKTIKGKKGENGLGKNQNGKNATDITVRVPLGTIISDSDTDLVLADLQHKDDEVIVAFGGRGGRGNTAFKTHSNPAPNFAENGEPGEVRFLKIELKMLADVGLVGMPSVGKSTIISMISKSKPKIADYHFTTLFPNLGVVRSKGGNSFVVADLPGLIKGASDGLGLGVRFLKHIERTRIIAHVIDMSASEGRNPYEDYQTIREELVKYSKKLAAKPEIIIANKMDGENSLDNLKEFKKKVKKAVIVPVTAIINEGLEEVVEELSKVLLTTEKESLIEEEQLESFVLYKFKKEEPFTIRREGDRWIVEGAEVEKLLKMTKFGTEEATIRFTNKLRKMGIDDKLRELGAEEDALVSILNYDFRFK